MSLILAMLLQVTVIQSSHHEAETVHCKNDKEAYELIKPVNLEPTPLGMIVGGGSDWGSNYLVVKTTHRLGVPGIKKIEGNISTTYYESAGQRVCAVELTKTNCPYLESALATLKARSYAVMHNRTSLRDGYAHHPPFAFLNFQDGDGNITKISARWSGHPLMSDIYNLFRSIKTCTARVEPALLER